MSCTKINSSVLKLSASKSIDLLNCYIVLRRFGLPCQFVFNKLQSITDEILNRDND